MVSFFSYLNMKKKFEPKKFEPSKIKSIQIENNLDASKVLSEEQFKFLIKEVNGMIENELENYKNLVLQQQSKIAFTSQGSDIFPIRTLLDR